MASRFSTRGIDAGIIGSTIRLDDALSDILRKQGSSLKVKLARLNLGLRRQPRIFKVTEFQ